MKKLYFIIILFSFFILLNSCKTADSGNKKDEESVIKIKNNIVLHQGLSPSTWLVTVYHKLYFEISSEKELEIVSINYKIINPKGVKILQETFKPEKPIHLIKGWDFQSVKIETENYGIGDICDQFLAMADDKGKLFPNTVEMSFKTTKGEQYKVDNLILKLQKDGWFIKVWHWVHETGCEGISGLLKLLGL